MIPAHDLGGQACSDRVVIELGEPVFHAPWERTARALVYGVLPHVENPTTAGFRHSIERMEPDHYLTSSYYEHWLTSAASLAVEAGLLTHEQLEDRCGGGFPLSRPGPPVDVSEVGTGALRFAVGDRVRVTSTVAAGHTRCPAYVCGAVGVVIRVDGRFTLPDVDAHSARRLAEGTYCVRITGQEAGSSVNVDLWDSYLEPV